MSETAEHLLKGPMPEIKKMTQKQLREECEMWRNIWGWMPHEVKQFVAKTGSQIGLTIRNYKRYLGVLLDTKWELQTICIGTVDKVFDPVRDKTYWEKKVVEIPVGNMIDIQWIAETKEWEQFEAEEQAKHPKEEKEEEKKES